MPTPVAKFFPAAAGAKQSANRNVSKTARDWVGMADVTGRGFRRPVGPRISPDETGNVQSLKTTWPLQLVIKPRTTRRSSSPGSRADRQAIGQMASQFAERSDVHKTRPPESA